MDEVYRMSFNDDVDWSIETHPTPSAILGNVPHTLVANLGVAYLACFSLQTAFATNRHLGKPKITTALKDIVSHLRFKLVCFLYSAQF